MEDFERPYLKVSRLKAVFLFLFHRRAFLDMAAEHDVAWVISKSPDIRKSYLAGDYTPNREDVRAQASDRADGLRKSLFQAMLIVGVSAIAAIPVGLAARSYIGELGRITGNALQAVAAGIILWATLWQLTRELQSFGGHSLPERVHSWLFNGLYTLGTFLFFVVYAWQA
jgi:hypothetical protein